MSGIPGIWPNQTWDIIFCYVGNTNSNISIISNPGL